MRLARRSTTLLILITVIFSVMSPVLATDAGFLTAPEAFRRMEAGNLVLIDVRSPAEWRQTGIPRGALTISIHHPSGRKGFLENVGNAVGPGRTIAIICASGVRSAKARAWLREAGFATVLDVREGIMGRRRPKEPDQPGWLRRRLPVETWRQ